MPSTKFMKYSLHANASTLFPIEYSIKRFQPINHAISSPNAVNE